MKTLKYDLDIYPLAAIKQAVSDYSHIAKIMMLHRKGYVICTFIWCAADENQTIAEFSNYLIDLIGSRGNIDDYT